MAPRRCTSAISSSSIGSPRSARLDVVLAVADLAAAPSSGVVPSDVVRTCRWTRPWPCRPWSTSSVDVSAVGLGVGRRRGRRRRHRRTPRGERGEHRDGRGEQAGAGGAAHGNSPTRAHARSARREQSPDRHRGTLTSRHAGVDAGRAALDHDVVRAGGAELRAQGRGHRDGGRARARDVRRLGAAHPCASAACSTRSASRPTVASPRSRGTRPATSSCTSPRRAPGRVLHTLNIRLFPEQLTYIVNHADDEVIFVDRSLLALLAPLLPTFERVRHLVLMDDGKGEVPDDLHGHTLLDYEELLAAADAGRVPHRRRVPRRQHVLHERHHGQPEGRRLHPSQHVPAHDERDDGGLRRRARVRPRAAGRADVPRQRVGPGPRRRRGRRRPGHARPGPVRQGDRRPRRRGARHRGRRRADDLDAGAARAEGPRHLGAAGDPVRRLGRPEGALRGVPRDARAADPAGVGDDRDEPRRVGRPSRRRPAAAAPGRAGRAARRAGPRRVRRRTARRRPATRWRRCRATARRAASCRPAGTGSRRPTTTTRGPPRASPPTGGCARATWRR